MASVAIDKTVGAILREILNVETVAPGDSFFDIGGNSLSAVKLIAEIENSFGADVLTPEELYTAPTFAAIVSTVEGNVRGFPDLTIGELFERQVAQRPDAVALRFRDRGVTYRELDRAANRVGWSLRKEGVEPGAIVGTAMARTPEFVATLLGILKVGAAYLPIDGTWPAARLRTVLDVAAVPVVVSDAATDVALPGRVTRLVVDDLTGEDSDPAVPLAPSAGAYVNFTSGSSGVPKGVLVPHRGVASLLFPSDYVDLSPATVMLVHSSPCFDAMTFELWGGLLHGGTCVLFDGTFPSTSKLRTVIRDNGVNTALLTTALFNVVVDSAPDVLAPLTALLTGGEAQSLPHIRAARERLPHLAITNAYGPTEVTVMATHFPVAELAPDASTVPLGRAINNRSVFVARADLTPVAPGDPGEICVAGPGLAVGYVGRPDLTAERFVTTAEHGRVYRTGDLGRVNETGNIEFLGRVDRQVKLNGHRIELEEIERTLVTHPDVHQAAVLVHGDGVTRALKAVLVTRDGVPADLPSFLARALPAYMVPTVMTAIDALPINTNGKIDRPALTTLLD